MSNMLPCDWEEYLASDDNYYNTTDDNYYNTDSEEPYEQEVEQELQDCQVITHYGIKRESAKAKFYITKNEFMGDCDGTMRGMWIPKSAIMYHNKKEVGVKSWCELTEVEWR